MKLKKKNRKFKTGITDIVINHVADLKLNNDELVTIKVNNKTEYDITRKNWGFYSTPSINKRLIKFGFNSAITHNPKFGTYFMMIVEKNKKKEFIKYLKSQNMILITWLTKRKLQKLKKIFSSKKRK